ncbi:MAG: L,D-transpeptidase family protein [Rhodobacteraceae bacterium]|nr:L,D-transpeptidase family protein [Paracoccaceae bacterium]
MSGNPFHNRQLVELLFAFLTLETLLRRSLIVLLVGGMMAACSDNTPGSQYPGLVDDVTEIRVFKSSRTMILYNGEREMQRYNVALGFDPKGHKKSQGDGKTPSGRYSIDRKNPYSRFHLSLGISYPNEWDRKQARQRGVSPGGDIMIHGQPNRLKRGTMAGDWTEGCIAVSNSEIKEIYASVEVGTPITIYE